jgi:hypothetical protein
MLRRSLLLVQIGEDSQVTGIYTDLKLVQGSNPQIALSVTPDQEQPSIIADLRCFAEIGKLNQGLGLVTHPRYDERLASHQKGLVELNLQGT